MSKQDIAIGVLAVLLFVQWGERRMLESRFEDYLSGLHWPEANAECTKVARAEYGAKIDIGEHRLTGNHWHPLGLGFGASPHGWPWRYLRWGQSWDIENASLSLRYSFHEPRSDGRAPQAYICEYTPIGGGGAKVYTPDPPKELD
jgi:hypothetical protein